MSIIWKYNSDDNNSPNKGIIDTVYCSHIEMSIPIQYYYTVLLKDGSEYDITSPILKNILKAPCDLNIFTQARENYIKLMKIY
jgi:hypothetical protein